MNNQNKFDAFICYDTRTGSDLVINLKDALLRFSTNAFIAEKDIPTGVNDEQEFRYKTIQLSKFFILVFTNAAFKSEEVRREIDQAIQHKREFLIYLHSNVDLKHFEQEFPKISKIQRGYQFSNKNDLARIVTDEIAQSQFLNKSNELKMDRTKEIKSSGELIVQPNWSVKSIRAEQPIGRIIFNLRNGMSKKIFIYGYRMIRIHPNGNKDFFYNGNIQNAENFTGWISDQHFKIILWPNDVHEFHWDDVNIPQIYGINHSGMWGTELSVAFLVEGIENTLFVSVGNTFIEYL